MVIGYLSCLIAPGYFKSERIDQPLVQQFEKVQNCNDASVITYDFTDSFQCAVLNTEEQTVHYKLVADEITDHFMSSRTCEGISFHLFSRPPPFIAC